MENGGGNGPPMRGGFRGRGGIFTFYFSFSLNFPELKRIFFRYKCHLCLTSAVAYEFIEVSSLFIDFSELFLLGPPRGGFDNRRG